MSFLSKLFGADKGPSPGQRANLKNERHFQKALERTQRFQQGNFSTIEQMKASGRFEPYHNWTIAVTYLDEFYIYYSMGKPLPECYEIFLKAANAYKDGWDESAAYGDMMDMVSLGYLLDIPDSDFRGIIEYVKKADQGSRNKRWKPDAILWYIINERQKCDQLPTELNVPSLYKKLFAITGMKKPDAEKAMKKYLETWYKNHHDEPWYENHTKDYAYKGYWSFESAAITKIMGLDDTSFMDHPHYPYELVHWDRSLTK